VIQEVLSYWIQKGFRTVIKDHNWEDITADELGERYYNTPEGYFNLTESSITGSNNNFDLANHFYSYFITGKTMFGNPSKIEYFQNGGIANESQEELDDNIKFTNLEDNTEYILFDQLHVEQSNIQSPYESLISVEYLESGQELYRCKMHPNIWRTDIKQIEGHCRNEHR
jgi:hypothetical protein